MEVTFVGAVSGSCRSNGIFFTKGLVFTEGESKRAQCKGLPFYMQKITVLSYLLALAKGRK